MARKEKTRPAKEVIPEHAIQAIQENDYLSQNKMIRLHKEDNSIPWLGTICVWVMNNDEANRHKCIRLNLSNGTQTNKSKRNKTKARSVMRRTSADLSYQRKETAVHSLRTQALEMAAIHQSQSRTFHNESVLCRQMPSCHRARYAQPISSQWVHKSAIGCEKSRMKRWVWSSRVVRSRVHRTKCRRFAFHATWSKFSTYMRMHCINRNIKQNWLHCLSKWI